MGGNQYWDYNSLDRTIVHMNTGLCLDKPNSSNDATLPLLNECDGRPSQQWVMSSNFKWQATDHRKDDQDDVHDENLGVKKVRKNKTDDT